MAQPASAATVSVSQYDQCQSQVAPGDFCSSWTNGGLNASNNYAEGEVVPQRIVMSANGTTSSSITISYDDFNSPAHGYDFLATWSKTLSATTAQRCANLSGAELTVCSGSSMSFPMASDPGTRGVSSPGISNAVATHELPQADRQWVMYGATITSVSAPVAVGNAKQVTVNFTPAAAGAPILLFFGGHLSIGGSAGVPGAWGAGLGAAAYPGGSLSMSLVGFGGRNNGIQTNGIQPLPPAAFTITKTANPTAAAPGQQVTYTVTVKNTGGSPGSTTWSDNFDDRLTASTAVSTPAGNNCVPSNTGDRAFTNCATASLAPQASQTFVYTANMPASFTSGGGTGGCAANTFPVANTAQVNTLPAAGQGPVSATVCVSANANFSVSKTVDNANPAPGATINYTVTVTNNGSAPGTTTWSDNFDDRLSPSVASSTPPGNNCTATTTGDKQFSNCQTGTIAPGGGTQTFKYSAQIPSTLSGSTGGGTCAAGTYRFANSATVVGGTTPATQDVCVSASPAFTITKVADDETPDVGQVVEYTITVTNTGNAAGSTSFDDVYDPRVTVDTVTPPCADDGTKISCTTGTIAGNNGTQVFTYKLKMPSSFTGPAGTTQGCTGYALPNTVTLTGSNGSGSATETVCVAAAADFTIVKSVDDDEVDAGDDVHYTIKVKNTGTASGTQSFTDTYEGNAPTSITTSAGTCSAPSNGQFTCNLGTVNAGVEVTITYTVEMPSLFGPDSGAEPCGAGEYPIYNKATLSSNPFDDVTVCVAAAPELSVTKSSDHPNGALPGDVVTWTVTVTNGGSAAGSTSFVDDFDNRVDPGEVTISGTGGGCTEAGGQLSCSTGVIPGGGQQTFSYSAQLPATVSGSTGGGTCGSTEYRFNNVVSLDGGQPVGVDVCVTASPAFTVTKAASDTTPDLGDIVTYTITVTNTGRAAGSTTFEDVYDPRLSPTDAVSDPAGNNCAPANGEFNCSTGSIPGLSSKTFVYSVTLPESVTGEDGGTGCGPGTFRFANTVTLLNGTTQTVNVCVSAEAAFTIVKDVAAPDGVAPGKTVVYTVTIKNVGDAPGSTSFRDYYDNRLNPSDPVRDPNTGSCTDDEESQQLECTTGSLDPGESQTFTYSAVLPASFTGPDGGGECGEGTFAVQNEATLIQGGGEDGAEVCVPASPDITVSKSVEPTTAEPGDTVTYTITAHNGGTAPGSTDWGDDFDDSLAVSSATSDPAGNDCAPITDGNARFECTTGTIDPGEDQTFTYTAVLPDEFSGESGGGDCEPGEYPVVNDVTVDEETVDSTTICVSTAPAWEIRKSIDDDLVQPGDSVEYTITVTNTGTGRGATSFTDAPDERVELPESVTSDPEGGECVNDTDAHTIQCETSDIDPGESQTFTYTGVMPETFTTGGGTQGCAEDTYPVANTATLDDDAEEPNADTATVCVGAVPDIEITKTVDKETAEPGETVTYTITMTNDGSAAGSRQFTDDYDDRLTDIQQLTGVNNCIQEDGTFRCFAELAPGDDFVLKYTAKLPATFDGEPDVEECGEDGFAVRNHVEIDREGGDTADATVCVDASPEFEVEKTVDDDTAVPGQTLTYTITVSNIGTRPGSTSFIDDFDDRLSPSTAVSDPEGNDCQPTNSEGLKSFRCDTGEIDPGQSQTFTYTVQVPASFTGAPGGSDCGGTSFPINNTVQVRDGGDADGVRVCVAASPNLTLTKTASLDNQPDGGQVITYTVTYTNTGTAEARNVVITDPVPTGTTAISCTPSCGTGTTPTWNVGNVAPLTGTGTVTLKVRVTTNQACSVFNTAKATVNGGPQISSNTVETNITPQPDPSTAKSNGVGTGVQLKANNLLSILQGLVNVIGGNNNASISQAKSSQTGVGGPTTQNAQLLGLNLTGILKADVLRSTSASSVTQAPAETRQTTTSEVAGLCLVPVAGVCTVEAGVVRAVASTMANGTFAAASSTGSTITNLKVVNVTVPVDLNQTTTIPLNAAIFGKNSYVAINERTGNAGLQGGKYVADQSVTMIHVKITGILLGVQAVELWIAQATAHSEFAKTLVCGGGQHNQSVSGHAYTARLYTGPLLADLLQGWVAIAPLGGSEKEHIAEVRIPGNATGRALTGQVADSESVGGFTATKSSAASYAQIVGDSTSPLCALDAKVGCVLDATLIRSQAVSEATSAGSVTKDTGTQFLNLRLLGIPIAANVPRNTVLPLAGIGFVILNEQFCDNGFAAVNGTCTGATHSGMTVRAVRIVITVANNLLGLSPGVELVIAEAHADSTYN